MTRLTLSSAWYCRVAALLFANLLLVTSAIAQTLHPNFDVRTDKTLDVGIGIKIDQISFVDQKSENYGAVVNIVARWTDPALEFDSGTLGREERIFKLNDFIRYVEDKRTFAPTFVIQNQQSNRWIHQSVVALRGDGQATYVEKSSLTLQAPHFDFRKYPFDRQTFYLELASVLPSGFVNYFPIEELSGLGNTLGEEEWILGNERIEKSVGPGMSGLESDRVILSFEGRRHVLYYVIRMFIPMMILILVSWSLFFLDEYRKRIEIAGGNLLVFVAFNWALSAELPKLGYLTFLDAILQWMFVVTGAVIVFNVGLRRLKVSGREDLARRLDNYTLKWIYPLSYLAVVGFAVFNYLLTP
ncbi:MAG: hypothetical protein AAF408_13790 [Pseudomonadota bacterium]